MKEIYLDNSATTKVCGEAAQKALKVMTEVYGNPSSLHTLGFQAERELTAARDLVAKALYAKPEEITFTSGGTEANNLALFGAVKARRKQGNRIVTTAIEHPSVLNVMAQLEQNGFEVIYLKPDSEGHVLPEQVREAITDNTILVSMMLVNNEVGTLMPIEAVAPAIARVKAPALFHVDAVQGFGKLAIHPARNKIDLMTISAHKIHGPKGVGALYLAQGKHIPPRVFGGGQERNLRPGTEPMPLIAAFGEAVRVLPSLSAELECIRELNQYCRRLLSCLPGLALHSPEDALPYILNFSAGSVRSETMLHFLASKGIYVSSGSACSKARPSHVLMAMGLSQKEIQSSLRVSFSRYSTKEDAEVLCKALEEGIQTLAARR